MKRFIFAFFFALVANFSFADQLAYISKDDAMLAAEFIRKNSTIYSYCGCCDAAANSVKSSKPIKLKVEQIIVRATGYENYYQVYVVVKGKEIALDLAYTWYKSEKNYYTIGEGLGLDHDKCRNFPK